MKKANKIVIVVILLILIITILLICKLIIQKNNSIKKENNLAINIQTQNNATEVFSNIAKSGQMDWKIRLVNKENPLPEDFEVELENIDGTRKFDKRAIEALKQMLKDIKEQGITNIWVQSAYRSIDYQKNLYQKSINKYLKIGISQEEAEKLTEKYINKPGTSEHNLGLAIDFNEVDEGFENTKAYSWLQENASKYGFILRYSKDKEEITGVKYEPWHWRYVGQEHAEKMKEQNLCLEEYVNSDSLI